MTGPSTGVSFPLHLDGTGRSATTADRAEIAEQLLEQLLFTSPGERLNRPQLGCGVRQLVFGAATPELQAAVQFQVKAQLQRWLGDILTVHAVSATAVGAELQIGVEYSLVGVGTVRAVTFRR